MKKNLIIILLLFFSAMTSGGIREQIAEIEKYKFEIEPPKQWYLLPNGDSVNLADWKLIIFIQSTCQYCIEFDPIIKKVTDKIGLNLFVFSFDGLSDGNFEVVYPVNNDIVATFFRDLPVATPTTFLVHVNELTTAPISQGSMKEIDFLNRLNQVFIELKELK